MAQFESQNIVLLHGITGSGKTEVYIDLIQQALDSGSQVLYLLPEIALTTQIVVRLQRVFGDKMGIYHSKFSDNERVEVWKGRRIGSIPVCRGCAVGRLSTLRQSGPDYRGRRTRNLL